MYILHPGLDRTEVMIHQQLYFPFIIESVQKEVIGCDIFQHTKRSTKKYDKFSAKLADKTPCNKQCVGIICPYKIHITGKEPLILKVVTVIYPVTGWFEITQYSNKKVMTITNLVETMWLVRYPYPVEITYD